MLECNRSTGHGLLRQGEARQLRLLEAPGSVPGLCCSFRGKTRTRVNALFIKLINRLQSQLLNFSHTLWASVVFLKTQVSLLVLSQLNKHEMMADTHFLIMDT